MIKERWYKQPWKLAALGIVVAIVFGIPSYIGLFRSQKVILESEEKPGSTEAKALLKQNSPVAGSNGLRALQPLETGKYLKELPDNVYGFDVAYNIAEEIEYRRSVIKMANHRLLPDFYEVQKKIDGQYILIGFVGAETYARLGELQKSPLSMTLLPHAWNEFVNPIGIPFDAVSKISHRRITMNKERTILILDIETKKVINAAQPH